MGRLSPSVHDTQLQELTDLVPDIFDAWVVAGDLQPDLSMCVKMVASRGGYYSAIALELPLRSSPQEIIDRYVPKMDAALKGHELSVDGQVFRP